MNLLFMQHLSHVKQTNSQPIHLSHDLTICIQITRGRFDFYRIFLVSLASSGNISATLRLMGSYLLAVGPTIRAQICLAHRQFEQSLIEIPLHYKCSVSGPPVIFQCHCNAIAMPYHFMDLAGNSSLSG